MHDHDHDCGCTHDQASGPISDRAAYEAAMKSSELRGQEYDGKPFSAKLRSTKAALKTGMPLQGVLSASGLACYYADRERILTRSQVIADDVDLEGMGMLSISELQEAALGMPACPFPIPTFSLQAHALRRTLRQALATVHVEGVNPGSVDLVVVNAIVQLAGSCLMAAEALNPDFDRTALASACRDLVLARPEDLHGILRGAIGEQLPGAVAIAARALDRSVRELDADLKAGAIKPVELATMLGLQLIDEFDLMGVEDRGTVH